MATMLELLELPGETNYYIGYFKTLTVKEPNDQDRVNAAKDKKDAKTKYFFMFQPNGRDEVKIGFDPEKFTVASLQPLQGAFCEIKAEAFDWDFNGRKGTAYKLVNIARIHKDATGADYVRK